MSENQTGKYFKYAIGEIILVVIGILIALQINNWNQSRITKNKESNYVNRLIEDLVADTTMMTRQMEGSKIRYQLGKGLDSMIRMHDKRELQAIKVIRAAQDIGRMWLPQYNSNTYDDLVNTGNFNIISNPVIADRIRTYYTNTPHSWNQTFDQRNEELRRIMVELIPLKYHVAVLAPESMPELPNPDTVLNVEEANAIVDSIINYPKIGFYIKNVTRAHIFHISLMEDVKKDAANLIEVLKSYKQ